MVTAKAVRAALYTKLNVGAITGQLAAGSASLHHYVAPEDSAYPLIIFNKQTGMAVGAFGGQAFKDELWLVKAVVKAMKSTLAEDIDKAVNDALDYQQLTVSGGTNLSVTRESDVDYLDLESGQQYRHHGALYRVRTA